MLKIIKAKPNPQGRDRLSFHYTPATKLAGEWVDIKNTWNRSISLNGQCLWHIAYFTNNTSDWQLAYRFNLGVNFSLLPGKIIRVHSGNRIDIKLLPTKDRYGADWHVFTGKNYIWNNKLSDKPTITNNQFKPDNLNIIDQASYTANLLSPVPNGKILVRVNNQLI